MRTLCLVVVVSACAPAGGDVLASRSRSPTTDDGAPCTPLSQRTEWPVKVVFAVQNSGGMCVADPPGEQEGNGFCQMLAPALGAPPLPARVRRIIDFLDANADRPNLSVALLPWDLTGRSEGFEPVSSPTLRQRVLSLHTALGKATNLQGGLQATRALLERDLQASAPGSRRRTRYVVVLIGTGLPYPRCAENDRLPSYATPANPELIWADSVGAGPFCNEPAMPPDVLPGFVPGSDLNQNAQIFEESARIIGLDQTFGAGDLRLHSRIVLSAAAQNACGPICQDVFGPWNVAERKAIGDFTFGRIAQQGQGSFENAGEPVNLSFSGIDTSEFTNFCP